jgi:ubiquinone/menaquinone biosynthesis C-methylase UbiE
VDDPNGIHTSATRGIGIERDIIQRMLARPGAPVAAVVQSLRWIRMADDPTNVGQVRDACRRIALRPGDRVIDIGCGPLGALQVLRDVVGPTGSVVGLDSNEQVLAVTKGVLRRRGIDDVTLIAGDINALPDGALHSTAPFDAAYCRLLLVNQTDPSATLRRIASLVRSGGHVIAHELLDDVAYPVFDPPVRAFARLRTLWHELLAQNGMKADAARHFNALAQEAGLELVNQQGFFSADPRDAAAFIQSDGLGVLLSISPALRARDLATEEKIGELAAELQAATSVEYRSFFSWMFVELIARVP